MDDSLLRSHQMQIEHQCKAAFIAMDLALQGYNARDQNVFWTGIQSFLTAAANVSKSLWGQGGRLAEQRRPLRESLGVGEDSPLAKPDLRNHLEHFDERLDRWYETSERHNFVDFLIGPEGSIVGIDETDIFRHYNPTSREVIFWGEKHALTPLLEALNTIGPRAEQAVWNGYGPEPWPGGSATPDG